MNMENTQNQNVQQEQTEELPAPDTLSELPECEKAFLQEAEADFAANPLTDVLDDEYSDFTQEGAPYTMRTMPLWLTITMVLVLLAVVGFVIMQLYDKAQQEQWILQQVDNATMADDRKNAHLWTLPSANLLREAQTQQGVTLYNATYFPAQHTFLVTVDVPEHFATMYCFVVDESGHTYAGWYNDSVVRYDIAKVLFEHIPTNQLLYLDCVDSAEVGEVYLEDQEYSSKIRFYLHPPGFNEQ